MTRGIRALWLIIAMSVRVGPWQSLICLAESAAVVLYVLQPLFLSLLVAGVLAHDLGRMALAASAFVVSIVIEKMLGQIGVNARICQLDRVGNAFDTRIAKITARIPTLDHVESAHYLDQLHMLRDQQGALGGALNTVLNTLNNLVLVGGTVVLVGVADWRLTLVAVAGIPSLFAGRWLTAWQAEAERTSAQPGRLALHLLDLGLSAGPGAEVRVFGLADHLRTRLRTAASAWRRPFVVYARRSVIVETASNVFFFAIAGAVLAWMVQDVIDGTVDLAAVILAIMLINRLQAVSAELQEDIHLLRGVIRTGSRFLWLLDYEREVRQAHTGTSTPPPALARGVRLKNLTFCYADSEFPAVDNISLDLPAGSVVALVGENGAGKSTLVKLLAGMYQPTSGQILIDDVDLAELDPDAWRRRMSGAFQDYATVEVTAGETVGLGDLPRIDDQTRIHAALKAGAAEQVVAALPDGLHTQLGPTWPHGVDLSGGQWQRLALARGMMRDSPLLLVLDEPTAALDATTEQALFERHTEAAHTRRLQGTITLLVTHRFSTVAAASHVVVLDNGRIIEQGTHHDLLAAAGHYAELYELQARGYR
jgi:ATP-binding cassette, subfamily B, bacterial